MIDGVLRGLGVDPRSYRVLVGAFRELADRAGTAWRHGGRKDRPASPHTVWWLYLLFGLIAGVSFAVSGFERDVFGAVLASSALVLIGLAVVADFATVVVSPGEDEILFHLPLSSRTYFLARLTVAARHVLVLMTCFAAAPCIVAGVRYSSFAYAPLLFLSLLGVGLFALVLAFLVYRVGLRWLGSERFKDLLAYLPPLLSLALYMGPQAFQRVSADTARPVFDTLGFLPPGWFAAVPEALLGRTEPAVLARAALAVLSVPLSVWILIRVLGGDYLADLLRLLAAQPTGRAAGGSGSRPAVPRGLARGLLHIRSASAAAGYLLYVGAMRSRTSRVQVFGFLALPVVMGLLSLFRGSGLYGPTFLVYMIGFAGGGITALLPYHEHHAAGWLYGALPIRSYGDFLMGIVRGIVARHVLPVFLMLVGFHVATGAGPMDVLSDLHGFVVGLLTIPFTLTFLRQVPFGRPQSVGNASLGVGLFFVEMLSLGVLGIGHVVIERVAPWAFAVTIPVALAAWIFWLDRIRRDLDRRVPDDLLPEGWPPPPPAAPAPA